MMKNFKKLKVWQKEIRLVVDVYKNTDHFPKEKLYGIASQRKRSATSIPSNITKDSGRSSSKDFNRFLDIALGSSFEPETQLIIAHEPKSLDKNFQQLNQQIDEERKMIIGLQKSLM